MQPAYVTLPAKNFVGHGATFIAPPSPKQNGMTLLPALWQKFLPLIATIPHRAGPILYGLIESTPNSTDPNERFYLASAEVTKIESLPQNMQSRSVPAGRYASFTHNGTLDSLPQTMARIFAIWLPASRQKLRNAPCLELYDQRFIPNSPASEFDILLPIH